MRFLAVQLVAAVQLAAALSLMAAVPAQAQENNRFALGVNYTQRLADDEGAHGNGGLGINWRLGHDESGWGREIGLGWFSTEMQRSIGGRLVDYGELKVRPFLGGYGYTYAINSKLRLTGDLLGGFAIVTFGLSDQAAAALRAQVGGPVSTDVSNLIPIVRPEVGVWYDVHPKVGISLGLGYTFARPSLTVTTAAGRQSERLRADTFALSAGLVYRIF